MNQTLFRSALMLALLIPLQSCAFFTYTALPLHAWIVDAKTHQPLEGVIVVAHWQLKGGLEGGNPVGQMMVMETVTDAKGRFYFPGWGPKLRPWYGELKDQSPGILLFKSGYAYQGLQNYTTNKTIRGDLEIPLRSDWNGKTIELEPFGETREVKDILRDFEHLNSSVETIVQDGKSCNWKKIPKMLLVIRKQRFFLLGKGITGPFGISSVDQYLLDNAAKFSLEGGAACGSPEQLFKANLFLDKP